MAGVLTLFSFFLFSCRMINKHNINLVVVHTLGWTMGHVVAVCGDTQQAAKFLAMGLDADRGDRSGWTARQLSVDLHGVDIFQGGVVCNGHRPIPEDLPYLKISDAHAAAIDGKHRRIMSCLDRDIPAFYEEDAFGYTPMDYLERLHHEKDYYLRMIEWRKQ